MSDLKPATTRELESVLLLRRDELTALLDPQLHRSDDPASLVLTTRSTGEDEAAETDVLNDTDIAQLSLELGELAEVEAALVRITNSTYGICTACGETIPLARLRAMPSAHFCLACQEKSEQRSGFPHSASL